MKASNILIAAATFFIPTACMSGNEAESKGNETSVKVKTGEFSKIKIAGSSSVQFVQGETTSVTMYGKEKDLEKMEIRNEGDQLYIGTKKQNGLNIFSNQNRIGNVTIHVTSPNLQQVSISGSGDFTADGNIDTDYLNISIAGSGDININDIICNSASAKISGSGRIKLGKLTTGECDFAVTGSGDINVEKAKAKQTTSKITGSGDIHISNADIEKADNYVTGSGSIKIKGDVKQHHEKKTGSGQIQIN